MLILLKAHHDKLDLDIMEIRRYDAIFRIEVDLEIGAHISYLETKSKISYIPTNVCIYREKEPRKDSHGVVHTFEKNIQEVMSMLYDIHKRNHNTT